jgi:diketogulonate reductase-like aldo/keto reductase
MKFTKLGKTGIEVSKICLGTMTFGYTVDEKGSNVLIQRALELGINFFDTANVYGRGRSEEILGTAIKERRADVVIASKVFWSFSQPQAAGLSRSFVLQELEGSLRRLQTDYIDIYYAHRYDASVSAENILRTFNLALNAGKIRHIGASTMHAWELMKSLSVADKLALEPVQIIQPQYNLLYREEEREMLPLCTDQNIAVAPWAPLAHDFIIPSMNVWGEYFSKGISADLDLGRDYMHEMDPNDSIIGSPLSKLIWGAATIEGKSSWPMGLISDELRRVNETDVETLLISGSIDVSTPAEFATNELLPSLKNGHQVILSDVGHVSDVMNFQPEAIEHLISTYFATGEVDDSMIKYTPMDFDVGLGLPEFTKIGLVVMGILSLGIGILSWFGIRWLKHRQKGK